MPAQIKPFEYRFVIRLHDTDAAGLLFFGHLFRHAHDACESFMAGIGFPLDRLIQDGQILLPLAHAEADYHLPLRHGDAVRVLVGIAEIRRRSFAIDYRFIKDGDQVAATARTVHVLVSPDQLGSGAVTGDRRSDRETTATDALSAPLRAALSAYLLEDVVDRF